MRLESARTLKKALQERFVADFQDTARSVLPTGARSLSLTTKRAPRTFALGVAPKQGGDYRLAVRIQHREMEGSREVELITKQAKGEVEVRYVGSIKKRAAPWFQQRQRPLLIGSSVGHFAITAGTIGGFVRVQGGIVSILSNNHVLANENRAKKGDAILQPGDFDGGANPADAVAKLHSFARMKVAGTNLIDAAVATIVDGVKADASKLRGWGKLKGVGSAFLDEGTQVAKIGRTTGLTRGHVSAFELDNVVVEYDIGVLRFDNQIEIESDSNSPFSDGGDSGSLIVGSDFRAVGLLFAGSDQGGENGQGLTYANPLHVVFDTLNLELVL